MTIWNSQTKQYHGVTDITVNDEEPALKITQKGVGHALHINDVLDDSTPFVINRYGQILSGYETSQSAYNQNLQYTSIKDQVIGNNGNDSSSLNVMFSSSSYICPTLFLAKSNSSIIGSQGIETINKNIGCISFNASDGVKFVEAASIIASVDGTSALNDMPGRITFLTSADGSIVPTERARINSSGQLLIGTTTAGASKLVVHDSSIQINTSKTPSAADATGTAGQVCWDADYVYVCVATDTWKRAAIATWP